MTLPAFMLDDRRHCKGSTQMWPDDAPGVTRAIAICRPPGQAACPFIDECLAWALEHHEVYGVWGGQSMRARGRMKQPAAPITHGTNNGYAAHKRRGELACRDCLDAHNIHKAEERARVPVCQRVMSFEDEATAQKANSGRWPYQCELCGMWHLKMRRSAA